MTANCCSDIPTNKCIACSKKNDDILDNVCAAPGAACRGSDVFGLPFILEERSSGLQRDFAYIGKKEEEVDGTCSTVRYLFIYLLITTCCSVF